MQEITKHNIQTLKDEYFSRGLNILYGAAYTGQQILSIMEGLGVPISYFVDDDATLHGTSVSDREVLSRQSLARLAEKESVNVILSSIYEGILAKNLEGMPVQIFRAYGLYIEQAKGELLQFLELKQERNEWLVKMHQLQRSFADEESRHILDILQQAEESKQQGKEITAENWDIFRDVVTEEEHYFIKQIRELLNDNSVLVDCGAFTGDILGNIKRLRIPFRKLYAFEANPELYRELCKNIEALGMAECVVPRNIGVWREKGKLSFSVEGIAPRAGHITTVGGAKVLSIPVDSIDGQIGEPIDLLKMDIEGAELPALHGAEKILHQSRPMLAISLYHSLDDIVDIPLYLMELLGNYTFFLKQHSITLGETLLYGIPNERI